MMDQASTFRTDPGSPLPLGATVTNDGVNFSIFSRHAVEITLVLFKGDRVEPVTELALDPEKNRTGDIWHIHVHGAHGGLHYAYRADGPQGAGHRFQPKKLLLDPYARVITGTEQWGNTNQRQRLCSIVSDDFDWEGDRPLKIPLPDTCIYELHVRGYTIHRSSGTSAPGTFQGLVEKIPYIKSLGVTAVELLPLFEFDEMEKKPTNPKTGGRLKNYWGYGAFEFFAPRAAYAANPENGNQVKAFKELVKAFHREELEVILDVVFNHTAERDKEGPTISFRGLDNAVYYSLEPDTKAYINISGCGNTLNCNHPVVGSLIIDCLRYWVVDMHVDGFRFDLATILARDDKGELLNGPSLIDDIEKDPILSDIKIIAEAWDMGAHLVGHFPGRWIEWNSFFKDDVRRFARGDKGTVSALATRIAGSSDLFQAAGRSPLNGVNYITCHDGFTLNDLVSYEKKYNEENGEKSRDGTDNNLSSNCGVEGPTDDPAVLVLRRCRMKTCLTLLMVSQGIPMVMAGDEFGRTQNGNNNAYCQDNETSWVNWVLAEKNADILRFFRMILSLRNRHSAFRRSGFLTGKPLFEEGPPDISWHGLNKNKPDWSDGSRTLAFFINGTESAPNADRQGLERSEKGEPLDNDFFVIVNGDQTEHTFSLPNPANDTRWLRLVDTGLPPPQDILEEDEGETVSDNRYLLAPSAVAVFVAKGV